MYLHHGQTMDRHTGSMVFLRPRAPAKTGLDGWKFQSMPFFRKKEASATILLKKLSKKCKTILLNAQCIDLKLNPVYLLHIDIKPLNICMKYFRILPFDNWYHLIIGTVRYISTCLVSNCLWKLNRWEVHWEWYFRTRTVYLLNNNLCKGCILEWLYIPSQTS